MKQVIIVNEELRLPRGKLAAQVAHAAVAAMLEASPECRRIWFAAGMPKVVLACPSEQHLLQLEQSARRAKLPVAMIEDAGRTTVPTGTRTCLGLGPASAEQIDALTRELKLVA